MLMKAGWLYVMVCWLWAVCTPVQAVEVSLVSVAGAVTVTVSDADTQLRYKVDALGMTVVEWSDLGITVDGSSLGTNALMTLSGVTTTLYNETYAHYGVHAVNTNVGYEWTIPVTNTSAGRAYELKFRVYDEGVAYRYRVPAPSAVATQQVFGEASSWTLPSDSYVWYHTQVGSYEGVHQHVRIDNITAGLDIAPPITVELPSGTGFAVITEAALYDYSGMTLSTGTGRVLQASFLDKHLRDDLETGSKTNVPPYLVPDDRWRIVGDVITPWRCMMISPDLDGLVNNDLIFNCNPERSTVTNDWSFVQPGRSVWSWWIEDTPVSYTNQYAYIDYAEQMGFEYVLVDDGWQSWPNRWNLVSNLASYAGARGVSIWLWSHYGSADIGTLNGENWPWGTSATRTSFFHRVKEHGAVGLKLDFIDSEALTAVNWYEGCLEDGAEYGLMINFHGANKPTGETRTYPNEMTREGIRGLEHDRNAMWWDSSRAAHNATLPFTRLLAGHGDYTPCTFNSNRTRRTSYTHQLATPILFTSPAQHWADHPTNYLNSGVLDIIKSIPVVWDETRVLTNSVLGERAVMARRSGRDWHVGVLNGGGDEDIALELDFLDPAKTYQAQWVYDDTNTRYALHRMTTMVTSASSETFSMISGGGVVGYLRPWPLDTDADGLPDSWEQLHFGSVTGAVANTDDDADGMNNLSEYIAGTVPTNGASYVWQTIGLTNTLPTMVLDWPTVTGRVYVLEVSTNISQPSAWSQAGVITGDNQHVQIEDINPAAGYKVYRLRLYMEP